MPEKSPDIWVMVWQWILVNLSLHSVQGATASIFMTLLRAGFMRKHKALRYTLLDAAICGCISYTTLPGVAYAFGHTEYSSAIGSVIGFIGTEKLREFLFKFLNKKTNSNE